VQQELLSDNVGNALVRLHNFQRVASLRIHWRLLNNIMHMEKICIMKRQSRISL